MSRAFVAASSQYLESTAPLPVSVVPITMVAWIKPVALGAYGWAVGVTQRAGANFLALGQNIADGVWGYQYDGTNSGSNFTKTNPIVAGVWQHIGCVFTSNSSRTTYRNGAVQGTETTACNPFPLDTLDIGTIWFNSVLNSVFNGELAEVAIWNAALTPAEMVWLSQGARATTVRPGALVFYAPLVGNTSPEPDVIGGRNLTVYGATPGLSQPPVAPVAQWDVSVERDNAGNHDLDVDAWLTPTALGGECDLTGRVATASVTLTPADLERLQAGEPFRLRIRSQGVGNAATPQLLAVEVRET